MKQDLNQGEKKLTHRELQRLPVNLESYADDPQSYLLAKIYLQNTKRNRLLERITNNVIFWFWLIIGIPIVLFFLSVLGIGLSAFS